MRAVALVVQGFSSNGWETSRVRSCTIYGNMELAENDLSRRFPGAMYDEYGSVRYEHHYTWINPMEESEGVFITIYDQVIKES